MRKKSLRNLFQTATSVILIIALLFPAIPAWTAESENVRYDSIGGLSGDILYDTAGNRVMACGGEIHPFTEDGTTKWYWFGVDDLEKAEGEQKTEGIHLYSSSDLYNWDYEGSIWDIEGAAHPKVLFDKTKKQYVMWVSNMQGKVSIGTSKSMKGPFTPVSSSGTDSINGFFNLYEESPGTAYVIYPDPDQNTFFMARLSSDYTSVTGEPQPLQFEGDSLVNAEGGILKRNGVYYIFNAGMSQYAQANSISGTWKTNTLKMWDGSAYKDITEKNQTSNAFCVKTENEDLYVCAGDSVGSESGEVRYIWLPIKFFEDGTAALEERSHWKLENILPDEPDIPENPQENDSIDGLSGEILYDTNGKKVYACGGEVHSFTENGETKWYWFGVDDLELDGQKKHPGIHLYSSLDLYNWTPEGTIDSFGSDIYTAHPKVLYNEAQKQYVMWVSTGLENIVATSRSIKGPFTAVRETDQERSITGFINLFQSDDGTAYLFYTNQGTANPNVSQVFMAKLSADYTKIEGEPHPLQYTDENKLYNAEGGIFEKNGKYYIVNAGCPDEYGPQYASADSLDGPWTVHKMRLWDNEKQSFEDITAKNQTSNIFHVKTQTADTFVCVGDSVNGDENPENVRYIWLPVKFFADGTIALLKRSNWRLDENNPEPSEEIKITGVKLNKTALNLKIGETASLYATVEPANATTDKTLTWISDRTTVAKVDQEGVVTGLRAGTANIVAKTINGKIDVCTVTVTADITVSLSQTAVTLAAGTDFSLHAAVAPANAGSVTWSSSNNETASVHNGTVTAKKAGTAAITAAAGNKTAVCTVTVVSLSQTELTIGEKESVTLKVEGAANAAWGTSNKKTATVSNGRVTGVKADKKAATITAIVDGVALTCKVTVKAAPKKLIYRGRKNIVLKKKKTARLNIALPKNTAGTLKYKSSNKKVASVDSDGKIKGIRKGTAKITVTAANNKKATLTVVISVK